MFTLPTPLIFIIMNHRQRCTDIQSNKGRKDRISDDVSHSYCYCLGPVPLTSSSVAVLGSLMWLALIPIYVRDRDSVSERFMINAISFIKSARSTSAAALSFMLMQRFESSLSPTWNKIQNTPQATWVGADEARNVT